ncbi:MAG: DUF4173 domain-containing protein [Clostridia bacterium]|nr:DUF4173 domain-containing protein [Clostridia bacterium]
MNEPVLIIETPPEEEKNNLSLTDTLFAWICLISAYLFCRISPVNDSPLGGFLFIVSLFAVSTVFLKIKGASFTPMAVISALSAVILCLGLVLSDNGVIHFFAYTYALVTYLYFVYAAFGNSLKKGFSDLVAIDYFKALFILPFVRFGALFAAVFSNKKGSKAFRRLLIGIGIAIIPTVMVLALLSYDASFNKLIDKIFDFEFGDLWSHFVSICLAFPLSAFGYGLFVSASEKQCEDKITADGCKNTSEKIKIAPLLTVAAATLPILVLYVIFFISQWKYYISGFTGVLPKGFVYSEYAREGFFQLCIVSVINLIIIALVSSFSKRNTKTRSAAAKVICILYAISSLVLIATAIAKLSMYIGIYGLTPLRVYAAWFEVVLAVIFILIILKQFIPRFNVVISSFAVLVVCFALLCVGNIDGCIADYNVDKYLDGSLNSVDIDLLRDLGDSAVPALVRLEEATAGNINSHADAALDLFARWHTEKEEEENIFSYTLPTYRAKALLKERIEEQSYAEKN